MEKVEGGGSGSGERDEGREKRMKHGEEKGKEGRRSE